MTDWAALRHAYGSAEDLPDLLAAAEGSAGPSGDAWDAVWSRLYHQGTVYPASFGAVPALAAMATRAGDGGYVPAVHLVACIVAATDGPSDSPDIRGRYSVELGGLRDMAERCLALAADDTEFLYGLEALMAFENGGVWQRNLNHVADGELPFDCPDCGEFLLLDLEGPEFLLKNFSDGFVAPTRVDAIEPTDGSDEARLIRLARAHRRGNVAEKFRHLFGRARCPSCAGEFRVPDALS